MKSIEMKTLVVMAAGLSSRFAGGMKQLEKVDDEGRLLMEYSIYDAARAGFDFIVIILRREIEDDFNVIAGQRIRRECEKAGVEVKYVFQETDDLPEGFAVPENRKRPWGTGHAVLSCRHIVEGSFAIINTDDFYGEKAYKTAIEYIKESNRDDEACLIGYTLSNTVSEGGGVTRGVCRVGSDGYLEEINETKNIRLENGVIISGDGELNPDEIVSMNMWCFSPAFMKMLESGFKNFLAGSEDLISSEFLIPVFVESLLKENSISVKVIKTEEKWFGMTYAEDLETTREEIKKLRERGKYIF